MEIFQLENWHRSAHRAVALRGRSHRDGVGRLTAGAVVAASLFATGHTAWITRFALSDPSVGDVQAGRGFGAAILGGLDIALVSLTRVHYRNVVTCRGGAPDFMQQGSEGSGLFRRPHPL